MKFNDLKKRLGGGEILPFYLITGSDEFLKSNALRLLESIVKMPEFNVITLDAPSSEDIVANLEMMPMMSEKRLVIVRSISEADKLEEYFNAPNRSSILVVIEDNSQEKKNKGKSERNTVLKKVLAKAEVIDCSPLDENTILQWIAVQSKSNGVAIERSAGSLLIAYCKNDMTRISSEFYKLSAYRDGGKITDADVRALVEPDVEFAVWDLSNAISRGDVNEAYRVYNGFDDNQKVPEVLFGVIYNHFRKLYYSSICSDDKLLQKLLGITEKALFVTRRECKKFSTEILKHILLTLSVADEDMKNSVLPRELASEIIIRNVVNEVLCGR